MEEDQYGMPDLRQYIGARPNFYPSPDFLSGGHHRGMQGQPHPYDLLVFRSDSTTTSVAAPLGVTNNIGSSFGGFESGGGGGGDGGGGAGRWPRQETLTLLEIRSRLDPKFKEANQKGPLWDEVSRIMSEEHGHQRSGKKCREKFENLYKYYKKTKEGKAGRQDGKHYRFFRQLEALYGETNNNNSSASVSEAHHHTPKNYPYNHFQCLDNTSLSLSNYSEPGTSSSDGEDGPGSAKISGKTGWKLKIKGFIDCQMKKMMEKQEAWMEKMMTTIEQRERERLVREEEWRKQDAERIEREHRFWAGERAWIEARDAALMEALHKLTGKELMTVADIRDNNNNHNHNNNNNNEGEIWATMDQAKFEAGLSERVLWEEMANKMGCLGQERDGSVCKDKWDSVNSYLVKCNKKKRKENSKSYDYYNDDPRHRSNVTTNRGGGGDGVYGGGNGDHQRGVEPIMRLNDHNFDRSSPSSSNNNNNGLSESCYRYIMGDATYGRIME